MYCTNCGKRIDNDSKRCPYCREPIIRKRRTGNKKKKHLILKVVIVLLVLCVFCGEKNYKKQDISKEMKQEDISNHKGFPESRI